MEPIHGHAKALYDLAINAFNARNFVHAVRVLRILVDINDPFYTPFALAQMAQCFNFLGQRGLELETFKRVTQLPKAEKELLNPTFLALCYQRSGQLEAAEGVNREVLELSPGNPNSIAALAELSLLRGKLGEAVGWANQIKDSPQFSFQVLGRVLLAFAHGLRNDNAKSMEELQWVGNSLASTGASLTGTWDYRDIEPLATKLGPNSSTAALLLETLTGKKTIAQFIEAWPKSAPAA